MSRAGIGAVRRMLASIPGRPRLYAKATLFGLALLTGCGSLTSAPPRGGPQVYMLYALGGIPTSLGMVDLAGRIRNLGDITVTGYSWDDYRAVIADIAQKPPDVPVALIGYSLGANATSWIAENLPQRRIALLIAYDPSIWYPVSPLGENVERAILYHNNGIDPLGHARIEAPRLETVETWLPHVTLDFDESLHKHTLAAVERQLLATGKTAASPKAGGIAAQTRKRSEEHTSELQSPS